MGFRFQRRLQQFPGVRLNFSRSGISTTIGVRGASFTLGGQGAHMNLGIPGTGLSFRQQISPESDKRSEARSRHSNGSDESPHSEVPRLSRHKISIRRPRPQLRARSAVAQSAQ